MVSSLIRTLSLALCLIAVGWFVGFAVEQSNSASAHQQAELNESAPPAVREQFEKEHRSKPGSSSQPSGLHGVIDEAFSAISSPFSGLTKSMSSPWTLHIVDTLLALLIYGFGLGFLARVLRLGS